MRRRAGRAALSSMAVAAALAGQGCNLLAGLDDVTFEGTGGTSTAGGGSPAGSGGTPTTESDGGTGGATGSTTSSEGGAGGNTSTGSATSTANGPVVPCGYPTVMDCAPGQVCCFDTSGMARMDHCSAPGTCDAATKYAELACNGDEDCPGEVCCAYYLLDGLFFTIQSTYCDTDCSDQQELPTCETAADCLSRSTCVEVFGFVYPDYKFCGPP